MQREARAASSALSLHGACRTAALVRAFRALQICRIQIAPPPLTPEMAISSSGRSALLDRPQIPPHSSARTERPPFFRLKPAQAHLLRQHRWLPLKRTCCVNTAGLPVALPRVARFLLVPPVVLPRVARFLLAPPVVLCAGSFRVSRRSYCASTASVLPPVSCRQVSGWRRPVRARVDFYWNLALSTSPTLVAVTVLTVPRAQKIEGQVRPDCSFAPTQRPCCLRFAPVLKGRELATRRNPR